MNGSSKGTSGVVDLGTVITSHQNISGKANLASPAFTGTPTAPTAAAGTNNTQIATTAFVNSAFAANDAMVFKGTIGSSGATVTALPATHKQGWTYRVITAGTYAGVACEIGDMIICVTDGTDSTDSHWTVVQTNIDGAVVGPASSTNNHVAIFNGTTGKIIKDSGYTIGASVPSGAKFTDTTYSAATTSTAGLMSASDKTKLDGIASGATANTGTITGIKMNGSSKGTSGVVNLGTVITAHQNISGKANKSGTVLDTTLSRGRKANSTVGAGSFAFGDDVTASGSYSHAEGTNSTASGDYSHAEGGGTASGTYSHAESAGTASGLHSHAEGDGSASGTCSHAEGSNTTASGSYGAHAEGNETKASSDSQHVQGKYNVEDTAGTYAHIVGNGTSGSARSNAHTLDWDGNAEFAGDVIANGCGGASPISLAGLSSSLTNLNNNIATINSVTVSSVSGAKTWAGQSYQTLFTLPKGEYLIGLNFASNCALIVCYGNDFGNTYGDISEHGGVVYAKLTTQRTIQVYINSNDTASYGYYRFIAYAVKIRDV